MAVDDFLRTYREAMQNKQIVNPLSANNTAVASPRLGIERPNREIATVPTYGSQIPDWLDTRQSTAVNNYAQRKSERTAALAKDYTEKAAGQIQTNEYGIPKDKLSDFSEYFNQRLGTIGQIGKNALATEEAKAQWQTLQNQAELNAGYQFNWTPGASSDNPGAKAVSIAMTAVENGTPYVWGGNSLMQGVDCSGLVQQVYKRLGIEVPRTTYEQARNGKVVNMDNLLPGDLVFYNTGSSDPNGIGTYSHVAIYIGNGQIIHAPRSGQDVQVASINSSGTPSRAVRPW
jgi:cell wall-associated NlpC family hydrolase